MCFSLKYNRNSLWQNLWLFPLTNNNLRLQSTRQQVFFNKSSPAFAINQFLHELHQFCHVKSYLSVITLSVTVIEYDEIDSLSRHSNRENGQLMTLDESISRTRHCLSFKYTGCHVRIIIRRNTPNWCIYSLNLSPDKLKICSNAKISRYS